MSIKTIKAHLPPSLLLFFPPFLLPVSFLPSLFPLSLRLPLPLLLPSVFPSSSLSFPFFSFFPSCSSSYPLCTLRTARAPLPQETLTLTSGVVHVAGKRSCSCKSGGLKISSAEGAGVSGRRAHGGKAHSGSEGACARGLTGVGRARREGCGLEQQRVDTRTFTCRQWGRWSTFQISIKCLFSHSCRSA